MVTYEYNIPALQDHSRDTAEEHPGAAHHNQDEEGARGSVR